MSTAALAPLSLTFLFWMSGECAEDMCGKVWDVRVSITYELEYYKRWRGECLHDCDIGQEKWHWNTVYVNTPVQEHFETELSDAEKQQLGSGHRKSSPKTCVKAEMLKSSELAENSRWALTSPKLATAWHQQATYSMCRFKQ